MKVLAGVLLVLNLAFLVYDTTTGSIDGGTVLSGMAVATLTFAVPWRER